MKCWVLYAVEKENSKALQHLVVTSQNPRVFSSCVNEHIRNVEEIARDKNGNGVESADVR